jgi:hypothetical protein
VAPVLTGEVEAGDEITLMGRIKNVIRLSSSSRCVTLGGTCKESQGIGVIAACGALLAAWIACHARADPDIGHAI